MSEGILWYDVYTGYSQLSNKATKIGLESKTSLTKSAKRRMSLLTNEEMS